MLVGPVEPKKKKKVPSIVSSQCLSHCPSSVGPYFICRQASRDYMQAWIPLINAFCYFLLLSISFNLFFISPHHPRQQYLFLTPIQNQLNQFLKTYNQLYYISAYFFTDLPAKLSLSSSSFSYSLHTCAAENPKP